MKLYEIDKQITDLVNEETGEIKDYDLFDKLSLERDKKIENIALYYKNTLADAVAYKTEKDIFSEKERVAKNRAESLKNYLVIALGGETFKSEKVNVTYRKSDSVVIDDGAVLPDDYLKYKAPEPDKTAIKDAMKSGISIPGCALVEKQNIQIK